MVFIPRDPVVQNQFLVHDTSQGTGTETAGCVVFLSGDQLVACVSGAQSAYGFLMQNVKAESSAHPTGFRLPGDLGSSDAFTGDPVAVAHLGLYDTTYYNTATTYTAGVNLTVAAGGRVTPTGVNEINGGEVVAVAQNSLNAAAVAAGDKLRIKILI
jgi:hypothetical protein